MNAIVKNISAFKIYSVVCLCVCGIVMTASATAHKEAVHGELWQKAVSIAEAGLWVPGEILQHEKVVDTKGKLQDETETHLQLASVPDGKIAVTVLKSVSNGKDATEDARKDNEGQFLPEDIVDSSNPFMPDADETVTVTRLDRQKTIEGKNCVAFHYIMNSTAKFTDEEQDVLIEGIAWLDEITGVPYEVENEIQTLPIKADKLTIKTFKQVEKYNYAEGKWFAVESEMNMDIEYKAFLITFKGNVNTVSRFSQHWKL